MRGFTGLFAFSARWMIRLGVTSMLLFVSGLPMTERIMEKTPGWEEYKKRTSVFIPWFPKKN